MDKFAIVQLYLRYWNYKMKETLTRQGLYKTASNIATYNHLSYQVELYKFGSSFIDNINSTLSLDSKGDISQSELFIRSYRPIENIINYNYTCKADIWALGCIFYEILTGLELFSDEHSFQKKERPKVHLHKITKTFGPIQKQMIENCDLYEDLFLKNKIKFRNKTDLAKLDVVLPFEQELKNNIIFDFDTETFTNFSNLIKLCFEYNPKLRIDCANLLLYIDNF